MTDYIIIDAAGGIIIFCIGILVGMKLYEKGCR